MKRSPLRRKTWMRRRPRSTSYSRRTRNTVYMLWVKTLPCAARTCRDLMTWFPGVAICSSVVEADHMGDRGMSQKCPDDETVPICKCHHDQRGTHSGIFAQATKEQLREWRAAVIARTQALWAQREAEAS